MQRLVIGLVASTIVFLGLSVAREGRAQGASVDIWLPAGTAIDADEALILQGPVATATLEPSCGVPTPGDYPMQSALAVDSVTGLTRLLGGVVVVSEVPAGTRVGSLALVGSCIAAGAPYARFVGAID